MKNTEQKLKSDIAPVFTKDELLEHWLGHHRVTRRAIEAFPEEKLFDYSIGGMRTFNELAMELIGMAASGARGVATGEWIALENWDIGDIKKEPKNKEQLLELFDWSTEQIEKYLPQIDDDRHHETDVAFGNWEGRVGWLLFYFIDNEIHHRAQGYVYLRSLDIEPPFFHE